ncbi:cupin domain-containing protein [Devosia nitrariae]|nr:cupin domain-containing protein [Devosia nitrariae]
MTEAIVNLGSIPLKPEQTGSRFVAQVAEIGTPLGLKWLGATYYIVPPGKTAVPFHRHHTSDEMFVILSGSGEYRLGDERIPVGEGDCLGAPAAGAAHQLFNTGSEPLRYLAVSNNTSAEVIEYPDSGRVRVDVGATGYHRFDGTFKEGGKLTPFGYWEGEDIGAEKDGGK